MYNDNENQFAIPVERMNELAEKIAKLNKKATKLGCPEVAYVIVDEFKRTEIDDHGNKFVVPYKVIEIDGSGPKIEGWTFLGSLDHNSIPGVVIVKSIPGVEFPEQFRHTDEGCDHCGHKRHRNNTYVLQNEEGDYKRVGSTCVKDFIGHDPKRIAQYLSVLRMFMDDISEFGTGEGAPVPEIELRNLLAITNCMIRNFGWVSAKKSRETEYDEKPLSSTSSDVHYYVFDKSHHGDRFRKEFPVDAQDYKMAEAAIEWTLLQDSSESEYRHNIAAIIKHGSVKSKLFGMACSIMGVYTMELARQAKAEADKAGILNEHFGEVKKRYNLKLTVIRKAFYDNQWGGSTQHIFRDEDGRTFIWWASKNIGMKVGKTYEVKGTVKKHGEYNDVLQTELSRVALQEGDTEGDYKGFKFRKGSHAWSAYMPDDDGYQLEDTESVYGDTKQELFENIDSYATEHNL